MNERELHGGDVLVCQECGRAKSIDADWIETVCARLFPGRVPVRLGPPDLARLRCSQCGQRRIKRRAEVHSVKPPDVDGVAGRQLAAKVIDQASPEERDVLLRWARELMSIRDSDLPTLQKAKDAIAVTIRSKAIWPFVVTVGKEIKRLGWDERSLPAKLGLSAAALAAIAFSGKGASIAALGGAIGVPLWVVFGAGGAFAGVIIEEISRRNSVPPQHPSPKVIEGEVVEKRARD